MLAVLAGVPTGSTSQPVELVVRVADLAVLRSVDTVVASVSADTFVVRTEDPASLGRRRGVVWVAPDERYVAAREPSDACWRSCPVMLGGQESLRAVGAPAAWDVTIGSPAVTVAVLDTAVDVTHPELAGKVTVGPDLRPTDACSVGDPVVRGHGTGVAAVAAASTDDGAGIAGMGWSTSILSIPVLDDCGSGTATSVARGITAAVERGARIINLSVTGPHHPAVADAVAEARRRGALVVVAAGNDPYAAATYPASYPGAVSVASTDVTNSTLSAFSTRGTWVDIAAPGEDVLTASPVLGGLWIYEGTSFAAPLVSGAAALLLAVHPHFDDDDLEVSLARSARPLPGGGVAWGALDARELLEQHEGALVIADAAGGVTTYGSAPFFGSAGGLPLAAPVVAIDGTLGGYVLAAADGGVFTFGAVPFVGSAAPFALQGAITDIALSPTGKGYWLLGADGGVFAFGDAPFRGAAAAPPGASYVGITATPTGAGYWLAASDGRVVAFGDAPNVTPPRMARRVVDIQAVDRTSYWLVDEGGAVGGAGGAAPLPAAPVSLPPVRAVAIVRSSGGYWVITSDGRPVPHGHVLNDGRALPVPTAAVVDAASVSWSGDR